MSFVTVLHNGIGESLADSLVVNAPFFTTGMVWYVHHDGTDAAAPAGRNRHAPLATLAQAQTNAADGDTVVLKDGHAETITSLAITKRLVIVGGGESDGLPTVKLTAGDETDTLEITGDGVQLRNIEFVERDADNTGSAARLIVGASRVSIVGCYFPCGQYDTGPATTLPTAESSVRFRRCTWESISAAGVTQPESALKSAAIVTNLVLEDCVFDGGPAGFSNHWALDLSSSTHVDMNIENLSLLRGADALLLTTATGWVGGVTATSDGSIDFTSPG